MVINGYWDARLGSEFVIGERFVELKANLYKDPKGGVFQKLERSCDWLFLHEVTFFRSSS